MTIYDSKVTTTTIDAAESIVWYKLPRTTQITTKTDRQKKRQRKETNNE
jgi:hypothetical protein